jgi:hypothetical protein
MRKPRFTADLADELRPLAKVSPSAIAALAEELDRDLSIKLVVEDDIDDVVRACPALREIDEDTKQKLAETIAGVHQLRVTSGKTLAEVVQDVVGGYADATQDDAVESADLGNLEINLEKILSVRVIRASFKARNLLNDRDKLYLDSRVLTDLRPVFDDELTEHLLGTLVTHSLKINVRTGREVSTLFVSLDTTDVKELKAALDRAIDKAAALASQLTRAEQGAFGEIIEPKE